MLSHFLSIIMKNPAIILSLILILSGFHESFSQNKEGLKIALVYPEMTKRILYKNDDSFKPTDPWELFFMSSGYKYEMVNDNEIGSVGGDVNVIVIPGMEAADDEIISEIEQAMQDNKGILITGSFAQFDGEGNKTIQDYSKRLLDFEIRRLTDSSAAVSHSLLGNTAISKGMKPGEKILLSNKSSLFYTSDLHGDYNSLGKYFAGNDEYSGIIAHNSSNSRLLWFGFAFDQLIGKNRNMVLFNSLKWLSSAPEAFINYWPSDLSSAVLYYKKIEKISDIDTSYSPQTGQEKINYFITPQIIGKSGDKLKLPGTVVNINLIWDDFFFTGLSRTDALSWLDQAKSSIDRFSKQDSYGILLYGEFYESDSNSLLNEEGYSFIFSSGYSDSFSFNYDSTNKVYKFIQTYAPGKNYESRMNFVLNSGGIFYADTDSLKNMVLSPSIDNKIWQTTFSELLDWVIKRSKLEVTFQSRGNDKYEIIIKNNSPSVVENAGIWISVPGLANNLSLEYPGEAGDLTFDSGKKMYFLRVNSIGGYQRISYRISAQM